MPFISRFQKSLVMQVWLASSALGGSILTAGALCGYALWADPIHPSLPWLPPRLALGLGMLTLGGSWLIALAQVFASWRWITRPMESLTHILTIYAQGDYSRPTPLKGRQDELGQIAQAIHILKENSLQAQSLQAEKARTQAALEASTHTFSEQAEQLLAATSLESVTTATQEAAVTSAEVNKLIHKVASKAESSRNALENTRKQMASLHTAVASITKITGVLGEMAEQISLLSLNASIEAARAGEAGRGFTVVAGEVKKLATSTAQELTAINANVAKLRQAGEASQQAVKELDGVMSDVIAATQEISVTMETQGEMMNAAESAIHEQTQSLDGLTQTIRHFLQTIRQHEASQA